MCIEWRGPLIPCFCEALLLRLAAIGSLVLALCPALAAVPTFTARQDIATGVKILSGLAIADFNGDGKPDFAFTDVNAKNVYVMLNDGKGNFGTPLLTPVDIGSTVGVGALLAGDVNEDGKQDLIVESVGGLQPTYVLLGNGDGRFTQAALVPGTFTAGSLVDMNGDGHLDLVSISFTARGPSLALGDGKGNFTSVALTPAITGQGQPGFFTAIVTGDFNRDGLVDLVVAFSTTQSGATHGLYFYANAGNNTFLSPQMVPESTLYFSHGSLATADFNVDGKLDLLDGSATIATIFPGYGDGTFATRGTARYLYFPTTNRIDTYPLVAAADLNADSYADALVAVPVDNMLYGFVNDGKGTFDQNIPDFSAALGGRAGTLLTADLNGDGLPDIVFTNNDNQNVSYFLSIRPKATATVALTSSTSQVLAGGSVSLTATVTGTTSVAFAKAKPTGTVSLVDGTQALAQATLDANGNATFSLPSLAAGTHTLTLNYAGDSNFLAGSTAGSVVIAVTDVTPALPAASQTIAAGGTATYTLNLTPVAGFSGTASFTCSGLPTGYSCSSTPVALAGQPATATVRVVGGSASLVPMTDPFGWRGRGAGITSAVLLLACCLPAGRRSRATLLLFAFAAVFVGALSGCSGGSNNTTTPTTPTPTTPTVPTYRGTTNFTITTTLTQGSQTVTHTTAATLVVQ